MYQRLEKELECDCLVIGAGLAGICAAIQAARLGSRVIIAEKFRTLGGNSGPEVGVHPSGAHRFHPYAAETGIIEEITEEAARLGAKTRSFDYHYNISQMWDSVLEQKLTEAGVTVLRCHYAHSPKVEDGCIKEVILEDIATYERRRVQISGIVIEASGDGNVGAESGAEYTMGREAQSEYQERSAPQVKDSVTLGSSLVGYVVNTGKPVQFIPPEGTPEYVEGYNHCRFDLPDDASAGFIYPTETGGEADTVMDDHEIYKTLKNQMYSAWDYIKNKSGFDSDNWELTWISPRVAKRESRRFIGDYVLTQTDVESGKIFEDAVAFGGFPIDLHDPREDNPKYIKINYYSIPPLYSIPYRCLYSKNICNLMFASRLMSVSHLAHGTVRLQRTLAACGQAAGVGAALCKKYNCTPREIYTDHLKELQQTLIENDASVPGQTADENLVSYSKISATSEKAHGVTKHDEWLSLEKPVCIMLWDWSDRIDTISCYVRNTSDKKVVLKAKLKYYRPELKRKHQEQKERFSYEKKANQMEWGADDSVDIFHDVKECTCLIEPGFLGNVEFPLCVNTDEKDIYCDEARYVFEIQECKEVQVGLSRSDYAFARRGIKVGSLYETYKDSVMFKLYPAPAYGEAENIRSGYARRWSTNPTQKWIPEGNLPESITMSWDEEQRIGEMHIVFDTLGRAFTDMPLDSRRSFAPNLVRDYDVEIKTSGAWQTVVSVKDNHKRFCRHSINKTADAVRIVLKSVWEDAENCGIYQVRIYPDKT